MKTLASILSVLFCLQCIGQKNFSGIIEYKMISADSSLQVDILTYFKKDKIKFITSVHKAPAGIDIKNETIILNFRDATIDRIKWDRKLVEREMMNANAVSPDIPSLHADSSRIITISGYDCIYHVTPSLSKDEEKDGKKITTEAKIAIWYARNLFFDIPDSQRNVQMVPLFTNDKIALGSDIHIQAGDMKLMLETRAVSIKNSRIRRALFRNPRGFKVEFQN